MKDTITVVKVIEGIKNGSIKLLERGHLMNSILDSLESHVEHTTKVIDEYQKKIDKGQHKDGGVNCSDMIMIFKKDLDFTIGRPHSNICEAYCFNCGARNRLIMLDEHTLTMMPPMQFYKLADEFKGERRDFRVKDIKLTGGDCSAKKLIKQGYLTADIKVETGELLFVNYFNEEAIYRSEKHDSINDLAGRDRLMQYMATKNVGYGQMGNMSIDVYSNGKDEILLGSGRDHIADMIPDKENYLAGKYGEVSEKDRKETEMELKQLKDFEELLKKGKFKHHGHISLSVWRWMCADMAVLKKHKEKRTKDNDDDVKVKVKPGTYRIEHYYDVNPCDGLYSRIKLIK